MSFTKKEYQHYTVFAGRIKFATPEEEKEQYADKTFKTCTKCGENKCLSEYNGNTAGRDAFDKNGYRLRRPECNACTKKAAEGKQLAIKIAKKEGIPSKAPETAECAICKTKHKLVFDHCHTSEVFRGWLCDPCNRSLGILGDNIEGLVKCINYLNKTEKKSLSMKDGELVIDEE